ncbi:MAG: hypothetical protein AAGC55_11360 [Myxococcota bacterium]
MADRGFERTDGATVTGAIAECLRECADLGWIAKPSPGAMGFDVVDIAAGHARDFESLSDDAPLARNTGCCEADFFIAVIVDSTAPNSRADGIAVVEGIGQSFEHNNAHSITAYRAVGVGGKSAALTGGRQDHAGLIAISHLRQEQRYAACEGHITLALQ